MRVFAGSDGDARYIKTGIAMSKRLCSNAITNQAVETHEPQFGSGKEYGPPAVSKRSLLIIDSSVEDQHILLAGLQSGTSVVVAEDGALDQLSEQLAAQQPVETLHVLAHGAAGMIELGGETVDADYLEKHHGLADAFAGLVANGGNIALWACSAIKGNIGSVFADTLSALTGAVVYGTDQPIGAAATGGTWDIGITPPFSASTRSVYPHTLPTFNFDTNLTLGTDSGADSVADNQATETVSGVTVTVEFTGANIDSSAFNVQGLTGETLVASPSSNEAVTQITVTFDTNVDVTEFIFGDASNTASGTFTFTPTGGSGASTINVAFGSFDNSVTDVVNPADWNGISGFTITVSDGGSNGFDAVLDNIVFSIPVNNAPALGGTPADDTATEDVATAIDLSAYNVSDADADTITLTLAVDRGTIASVDGNGTFGGVTVATSGTTSMTLEGTAANLNTYLNAAPSNITYTTDSNDTTTATLTVTPNDGTTDGTADTVNISINAVNDDPTIATLPSAVTVTEDTQSNIDLSATSFADVDSASITVTLDASAGTFATPADGAGVGSGVTESLVSATRITLVGSPADINTYLDTTSNIQYTAASNVSGSAAATITVTMNDGDGSGDVAAGTVNVNVTAVNDNPTVATLPASVNVTEDTQSNVDLSATSFADVDSASITVTLTASAGTFATPVDGAGVGGGVTETLVNSTTITLVGSPADINTYLDTASNIQYTGAANASGTAAATITVTANDGDGSGNVNLGTVNVNITGVNDDPTVATLPASVTVTEDTQSNVALGAASFADIDGDTITVTLTASAGTFATPSDGAGVGAGVTETLVNATTITLVGAAADINTYLDTASNIQYTAASNVSGTAAATITVTANDGAGSGDVNLGTVNVDVTAVNDNPTVATLPAAVTVTEDTQSNVDLSATSFADVDSASITVTLTASAGTFATPADGAGVGGGVTETLQSATEITLVGSPADITTYLDTASNIQYTGAANASGNAAATITVTMNDGDGSGNVAAGTVNVNITGVNDDPTVSGLVSDIGFLEDTASSVNLSAATIADVDSASITVTITASEGTFSTPADGNGVGSGVTETLVNATTITLVGSPADISTYLDTTSNIQWTPASNDNGGDTSTFTITANDGDGSGDVALGTINADVTAVNDDPTISGLVSDITVTEDTASDVDLSAADFDDIDSAGTVFVTLTASAGTLNSGSGGGVVVSGNGTNALTLQGTFAAIETFLDTASNVQYVSAANAAGNDAATLTVEANDDDGSGDVNLGTVNLDITAVNDDPTLASLPSDVTVTEDTQSNIALGAASFADVDGDNITVTLTASSGTFATPADGAGVGAGVTETLVNAMTITLVGAAADINTYLDTASNLQYTAASNVNGDNIATITVTANDGAGSGDVTLGSTNIDATGVNDVPAFTGLDATPGFTEDGTAVILDADVTVVDNELDSIDDFSGASLVIARNGGVNTVDTFSITSGGNLTVAGSNISAGGNVIATFDTSSAGQVTVTFADNGTTPTGALVDEVLQAVRYSNSGNDPDANVQLDWTFSDGNSGNAQGTGDNPGTTSGSVTVSITGVNDEPTLTATGGNPTFTEGGGAQDLFNTVTASTVESADRISSMTLTVTNVSDGSDEILSFDGSDVALTNGNAVTTATNGLSVSVSVTGSTATVSFTGETLTSAQFQTLVDGLTYRNASEAPTTAGNRVVTITSIQDSGGTANSGDDTAAPNLTSTVSLTAVNSAPTVTGVFGDTSSDIIAGTGAQDVSGLNDATVSNPDSTDYNGGFLTIAQTAGTTNGSWGLDGTTVTAGGDATVSAGETIQVGGVTIGTVDVTDDGQGGNDLTINFTTTNATSANIQTLLRGLTYSGPSGIDTRSFTLTLNDNDGTANSGDEDASGSFSIDITPNPPVIGNLDGDSFTYTEGAGATDIDVSGNATLTDADSADFDGGDLTIEYASGQQAEDRLEIDTSGSVSLSAGQSAGSTVSVSGTAIGTIDGGSTGGSGEDLVISLNSSATPALVQTLVQGLQYNNAGGDNPTDGNRVVRVTVSDGDGATSANADITINVDPVNDDPAITGLVSDVTVTEDTAGDIDLSAATIADDDSDPVTVTLSVDAGTFAAPADGAGVGAGVTETLVNATTITLVGSAADINTYLDTASNIQYTGAANAEGDDAATITLTANDGDGSGNTTLGTVNVDITAVNDTPEGTDGTLSVTKNRTQTINASQFGFTDVDDGDALASVRIDTLPVAGAGELQLSGVAVSASDVITVADINAGNLQFVPTNGVTGNGIGTFTFSVNDGTGFDATPNALTLNVSQVFIPPAPAPEPEPEPEPTPIIVLEDEDPTGNNDSIDGGDANDTLQGGAGGDSISGGGGGDALDGGAGSDALRGNEGDDTILGGEGDDIILGGTNDDFLRGDAGDDRISGGAGNDQSFAGPNDQGNDTVEGNGGDDVIGAGAGNDLIVGGDANASVEESNSGNAGSDTLFGGEGDDLIIGGSYNTATGTVVNTVGGENLIWAGAGNDTVFGDTSDDILGGGTGSDFINAGGGADIVYGGIGDGNDTVFAGNGDDQVFASAGADLVSGDAGDDTLFGGAGDDTVDGGADDDLIYGGAGDDSITGGTGDDTFAFITGFGSDTITDFGTTDGDTDILDFSEIEGLVLADLLVAATFDANGATLTIGTHGTIALTGIDQDELQAIFDNGQIVVG